MLRAGEDLKWTWQPRRLAAPTATKRWRTHRSLPPTSVYTAGCRGSRPHIPANRATLGGQGTFPKMNFTKEDKIQLKHMRICRDEGKKT